ncbi:chondroitinase-B domain-containing protein [Lutibacter holmesii]|uniref:Chondroitinase-B domain-containing protein n=1 Tax=Lutibacter holmesii TaxID=1137985 RepID=A0ABW3WLM5_9FLAO
MITFLLFTQTTFSQTVYYIDDPEKLEDQTYVPGDTIILLNGVYDTDERITFIGDGTEDAPITFRAESPGGVIFTGGLKMNIGGDYVVVDGFHWKGGYGASNFIQFRDGYDYANHSTMQNCAIDGLGVEPDELAEDLADGQISKHRWIVLYGTYNTVINCTFMNKVTSGALILGEYSYNAFPAGDDGVNESCNVVGHRIMNNYFYNFEKMDDLYAEYGGDSLSNAGDCETIRLGTSSYQMVNSNSVVSNNYFVKSDGENEIITNKSKGNTYTNNTFRSCRGSLVLRHGSYGTIEGNYFLGENVDGTGGIRITDSYHSITNNYIQDCTAVINAAKWNNGITFIGGSANNDVACTSDDVSNGYQKTVGITVSNNSIVNTNAPLYYNNDKGSTDPTGSVTNNLIYFADGNQNVSEVISGDVDNAYENLGTALSYSGNVYTGTTLGATNTGFSEDTGITATASGEIFTFSGANGKGADMGAYKPTTDDMVGYGIGACFLDFTGSNITDGDCTIEIIESISVGVLSKVSADAGNYDVTVTANVGWTAESNDSWITIDPSEGTGNATVVVSVTENVEKVERTGTVTFTQVPGGDDIVKTLTVNQEAADVTAGLTLINDGTDNDNVVVHSVFHEEITDTKNNIAINSLDKNTGTQWSGNNAIDAADMNPGTNVGEIIYDLGGSFDLQLVDYMATNGKTYEFQILVSSTTTDDNAFTNPFGADNLECATEDSEFTHFLLPSAATATKYVKIIGYGQPKRPSTWNTIVEIEFYGTLLDTEGDDDNDGVMNNVDLCPNTAAGAAVDANGCSADQQDDDNDGVQNGDDICPDTPEGEDVNDSGCSDSQIDDDNDGVMNNVDLCPDTAAGEAVDANGCSADQQDDDNDGVQNGDDICPDTPEGEDVNDSGCSDSQIDDDNDGVMNNVDACPNTPAGEAVDATGCADSQLDDDGDGVMNNVDQCPNTPAGEAVDTDGCGDSQLDDDGDGVMNNVDQCPETPAGEAVDTDGCGDSQLDDDGDGVMNNMDQCPSTPAGTTVNSVGCFTLSSTNFSIETVGESCPGKSNGKIIITATESFNYKVTIDNVLYNFTDVLEIENLAPSSYDFCISVENETYEQCFTANIVEGISILAKANVKSNKASITISQGTAPFNIFVNGKEVFETMDSTFSVDVANGDSIEVKTSVDCEGVFAKEIDLFENMTAYPNPTTGSFEIGIPVAQNEVIIELYNMQSQLISSKSYTVKYGKVSLNIESLKTGMYFAKIKLEKPQTIKIMKK